MKEKWKLKHKCLIGYPIAVTLLITMTVPAACSRSPFPGEQEEIFTRTKEVPIEVLAKALGFCDRIE